MPSSSSSSSSVNVAILGAGGLGRGMARMLEARSSQGFKLVALADSHGYCFNAKGIESSSLSPSVQTVAQLEGGIHCPESSCLDLLKAHGQEINAIFMALPNLPVTFYADTLKAIAQETPFSGVMVDALKRTEAVEHLLPLDGLLKAQRILYITGAGATPGFLTTVAAVAAQSFVEVEAVDIHFGVGVANWEAYRATIREDFLHINDENGQRYTTDRVSAMTDADIEAELEKRGGKLELVNMEHADDIILELAGVCSRDKITVGGVVDTRSAQKPVATTVTVKGITVDGHQTEHQFVVGNATTMVDNVCGPACGFMARGVQLLNRGTYGLCTSAEIMPSLAPVGVVSGQQNQKLTTNPALA